jgi:hypothetical protein
VRLVGVDGETRRVLAAAAPTARLCTDDGPV